MAFHYLPILPLPNVVFFPRSLLPLHIFESRYRKLVESALSGDRRLGVALLKPGWERDYYDSPPVYRVLGMGKIINHDKLGNGNYDIWLSGLERVEVIYEIQEKPFRVAKTQVIPDVQPPMESNALSEARRRLIDAGRRLAATTPELRPKLHKAIDGRRYPGALADSMISIVCSDNYEKQCVLAEYDLVRRLQLTTIQMLRRLREAEVLEQSPRDLA